MSGIDDWHLDPDLIHAWYEALRDRWIEEVEERHDPHLASAQPEEVPRPKSGALMAKKFGVSREEITKVADRDGRVYRDYYESKVRPKLVEGAAEVPPWPVERLDPQSCDPRIRRPIPYAVLAASSDAAHLEQTLPGAEVHNPWAELVAPGKAQQTQKFHMEVWGEGSGMVGFWPGYLGGYCDDIAWVFMWLPGKVPPSVGFYNWGCVVNLSFFGAIHCYAHDTCVTSKEAEIRLKASVTTVPLPGISMGKKAPPTPKKMKILGFVSAPKTVIYHSGYDISVSESGYPGWKTQLKTMADFFVAEHPHFILVEISAGTFVRGSGSHALLDFSTGNYGIHCEDVEIFETWPSKGLDPTPVPKP
jgi:hypothetical protein